jgi:hypothetical protein
LYNNALAITGAGRRTKKAYKHCTPTPPTACPH